uniref:Gfo/Idh/MocA family oxidoreductase n=1 Tax=Desertihabitans aurantiacus TaxID=2282477 RepID=UPI0018E507C2
MDPRYRIGVVGLGRMGRRHLDALATHPRWRVAWACDPDPDARRLAAAAVPGVLLLDDADAALARGDVDAVAVVTSAGAR